MENCNLINGSIAFELGCTDLLSFNTVTEFRSDWDSNT